MDTPIKMVCPHMDTCGHIKVWRRPEWAPGKEPHDDYPGEQVSEKIVPQGHCLKHSACSGCATVTPGCPACVPV